MRSRRPCPCPRPCRCSGRWSKCPPWQRPSSPPVPPQRAPGGSRRLGTPQSEAQPLGPQRPPRRLKRAACKGRSPIRFRWLLCLCLQLRSQLLVAGSSCRPVETSFTSLHTPLHIVTHCTHPLLHTWPRPWPPCIGPAARVTRLRWQASAAMLPGRPPLYDGHGFTAATALRRRR